MGNLKIDCYTVGMVRANCYVVINTGTKECIVIDPGASGTRLAEKIRSEGYVPKAVLLTHGHFDHVGAAETLAKEFEVEVYAHEAERETLEEPEKNAGYLIGANETYHADRYLGDGEELKLAGIRIRVIHTPGHTPGGCCYYLPEEAVLFSGDTLFAQSVGRTDLAGGSAAQQIRSIREKLLVLPAEAGEDITVYPGHNEVTTIETERKYNPYL